MTVEEFYTEYYEHDSNHFYTSVGGVEVISPRKVQQAMEDFARLKCADQRDACVYEYVQARLDQEHQAIEQTPIVI